MSADGTASSTQDLVHMTFDVGTAPPGSPRIAQPAVFHCPTDWKSRLDRLSSNEYQFRVSITPDALLRVEERLMYNNHCAGLGETDIKKGFEFSSCPSEDTVKDWKKIRHETSSWSSLWSHRMGEGGYQLYTSKNQIFYDNLELVEAMASQQPISLPELYELCRTFIRSAEAFDVPDTVLKGGWAIMGSVVILAAEITNFFAPFSS